MTLIKPAEKGFTFYEKPNYPDVPLEEYQSRIKKAQKLMRANNIDCLVLWSKKNIRYFFGFQNTHWLMQSIQPAVGIIPVDQDPVIVVPKFFIGTTECQCWIRNIWAQDDPHQPKSERELPVEIANLIKELGYGNGAIAQECGPLGCMSIPRPINDIRVFEATLPDAHFVDGDKVIWGCRMFKSELEVSRIKTSIAAIGKIEEALVGEFRPGMTETDLSIIVQRRAAELGTGFIGDSMGLTGLIHAAADKEPMADIGIHEQAKIMRDDTIIFDMSFDYKGYNPDVARIYHVGPVTDDMRKYHKLVWDGVDNVKKILKPGVPANELWHAMYDPIQSAGLPALDMGGHGTGLDVHEPPSIDAWNETPIEEGMVLSIEPWLHGSYKFQGGVGKFATQDQFLVTKDGSEFLEAMSREIIQVAHPFD